MLQAALQISPEQLRAIVPDCYAEFRPIVADGLTFFLHRLPPHRLTSILAAQAQLPHGADLPQRLVSFLAACPGLHKLGQVLARNRHLDSRLRAQLQLLESMEPHTPMSRLWLDLDRELHGTRAHYQIVLRASPLAEGSVAVVIPLTWRRPTDAPDDPPRRGVAKVLKPGIVDRMEEDLDILRDLADHMEESQAASGLPDLPYRDVLDDVAELLTHEVHLEREQQHLASASTQYGHRGDLRIPGLLPFCTRRLTGMEFLEGPKITAVDAMAPWERSRMFQSVAHGLLLGMLLSPHPSALFHGDPHAGNLLATVGGRVGVLDWSLAGRLTSADRSHLVHILLGAWTLDASRIARAIESLAVCVDQDTLMKQIDSALERVFPFRLPGVTWLAELLDGLARGGVRFPPRLLLFRKAFFTLQGVLADICPWSSLEWTAMQAGLSQMAKELPARLRCPIGENPFPSRLSNLDLASIVLAGPQVFARRWQRPSGHI